MLSTLLWELRQRKYAILWWTIGSVVLTLVILLLFPSIKQQADQLNKALNSLPDGIRELKTGGSSAVNVADPISFINSQLFYATLPIIWIILAITRGSAILGRDEENHTLELLLARPISRGHILLAKALALVAELAIIGTATAVVVLVCSPLFGLHLASGYLLLAVFYTAAFSLSFGLITFTLQAFGRLTRRGASALAVVISFGGYLLTSLSGMTHWLIAPARFVPYHYFAPDLILQGRPVHKLDAYLLGVLIVCIVVSYLGFRRRDIS